MTQLKTQLNPRSADFQANAAAMQTVVADLHEKVEKIALGGPEAARQKHLARGKLLPRERVNGLLDPGTPFLEIGQFGWRCGRGRSLRSRRIFSDLFGPGFGGARTYSRMRGRDIRFTLDIDFLDSINGAKRRISLAEGRTLDVAIPAGVETGQVLRLKNQGGAGVQGGPAGDALVELRVRPNAFFRREGQDVHMDLSISLTEALEGARIQAPTPGGNVTLTIPAGSNTGKVLRLKGKGVAGQGDQFVRLQVVLPEIVDEDLRKFVKKWPKRAAPPPRPNS